MRFLRGLIHKELFRAAMIPLLVIELFLIVLYFSINAYVNSRTVDTLRDEVRETVLEISSREARNIDLQLSGISESARLLLSINLPAELFSFLFGWESCCFSEFVDHVCLFPWELLSAEVTVLCGFLEDLGNLHEALLPGLACSISVPVSRLGFTGKGSDQVLFRLGPFQ